MKLNGISKYLSISGSIADMVGWLMPPLSKKILGIIIASIVILCSTALLTMTLDNLLNPLAFGKLDGFFEDMGTMPGVILSPDQFQISLDGREPEEKDLFRVSGAEHTQYLRCFAASFYDGQLWKAAEDSESYEYNGEEIEFDISNYVVSYSDDITITPLVEFVPGFIPTSLYTSQLSSLSPLHYYPEESIFYLDETSNDNYSFTASNYQFTETFLEEATVTSDPKYLQLPDNITQRTRDLSEEITRDYTSPFLKARAIAEYLRDNYTIDPDYIQPPDNYVESTDWFLFESKSGISTHFSSAFVILARCAEIPSRVTSGYKIETSADEQIVDSSQITCLPEVLFNETGWMTYASLPSEEEESLTAEKILTKTTMESISDPINKGIPFVVEGEVLTQTDMPVSGMPVQILISPSSAPKPTFSYDQEAEYDNSLIIPVGLGYTEGDGSYKVTCLVPAEITPGEYNLIARSLGLDPYLPSDSDPSIIVQASTKTELLPLDDTKIYEEFVIAGSLVDAASSDPVPGVPIEIALNGFSIGTVTTGSNGAFSIPYTSSVVGDYTVTALFAGNEYYLTSGDTTTVRIYSTTTTTLDIPSGLKVNSEVSIHGLLLDSAINPISGQDIEISIDGITIGNVTTNQDGEYILNHTFTNSGDYAIAVDYSRTDYYLPSSASSTIRVYGPPTLTLNSPATADVHDTVTIQGNLCDEFGDNLASMTIDIKIDDTVLSIHPTTDGSGNYSLDYIFDTAGDYIITAVFNGNALYPAASASSNITISIPTTVTVTLPAELKVKTATTIQGTLEDSDHNPLQGKNIQLQKNGANLATVTTAADGTYSYNYTFTDHGEFTILASFAGGNYYLSHSASSIIKVYGPPTLTLNALSSADIHDTVTIQGNLHDEFGDNLANMNIDIKIDDTVLPTHPITDSNGNYSLDYTFNIAGDYTITAVFNGNALYPAASASSNITISIPTTITMENLPTESKINTEVTIQGVLKDVDGNPLSSKTIQIQKDSNTLTNVVTEADGSYSYSYTFADSGDFTITAAYAGSGPDYLKPSSASSTIRVYGPPTLALNVPGTANIDDTVNIQGNLHDEFGDNLDGMTVYIGLDDDPDDETNPITPLGQRTTDANGDFSLSYQFTIEGDYVIYAAFNESGYYPSTSASSNITISIPTTVTIALPTESKINTQVTIQGTLEDVDGNPLSDKTVQIRNGGDDLGTVITGADGSYSYDYTFTDSGDFILAAAYAGSEAEHLKSSSASSTIRVYGPPTLVLNAPGIADIGDTIDIQGNLHDEFGNNLANMAIDIKLDGSLLGQLTTDANGNFSLSHQFGTKGDFVIQAVFNETGNYPSTSTSSSVTISIPTTVTVNLPTESKINTQVTIQGFLKDENDNPLSDKTIQIRKDSSVLGTVITGADGSYSYDYTFTDSGDFTLTAAYAGSEAEYLKSSSVSSSIRVYGSPTLVLNAPGIADIDDTIDIQGNLHDEFGNNLANMTIDIKLDDSLLGQLTTDANGNFSLSHILTTGGDSVIQAIFNESGYYPSTSASSDITISIPTTVTIALPTESKINTQITIQGALKDVNGNPLPSKTIQIRKDSSVLGTVITGADGSYSYSYTFADSGDFIITAVYAGSEAEYLKSSSVSSSIRVYGSPTLVLNAPGIADIDDTIDIQGNLYDEFGNNLANMTIYIGLDDDPDDEISHLTFLGKLTTDADGNFSLSHQFTTEGDFAIQAIFNGSEYYPSTSTNASLRITEAEIPATAANDNGVVRHLWWISLTALLAMIVGNYTIIRAVRRTRVKDMTLEREAALRRDEEMLLLSQLKETRIDLRLPQLHQPLSDTWGVNDDIEVECRLLDNEGQPISEGAIEFWIDQEKIGEFITNNEGICRILYRFNDTGRFGISYQFHRNNTYRSCSMHHIINIIDYREEAIRLLHNTLELFKKEGIVIAKHLTLTEIKQAILIRFDVIENNGLDSFVYYARECCYSSHIFSRDEYINMLNSYMSLKEFLEGAK